IPISGFFEWKTNGSSKRPFKIHLLNEAIMSVAGIWSAWRPGTPQERHSFSILTTAANEIMREIHDRMPVILGRDNEGDWLDPDLESRELVETLLKPCPSDWLTTVEVSSLVNSAKNNSLDILTPFTATTARTLFEL